LTVFHERGARMWTMAPYFVYNSAHAALYVLCSVEFLQAVSAVSGGSAIPAMHVAYR
jgi:hypothetical protein